MGKRIKNAEIDFQFDWGLWAIGVLRVADDRSIMWSFHFPLIVIILEYPKKRTVNDG